MKCNNRTLKNAIAFSFFLLCLFLLADQPVSAQVSLGMLDNRGVILNGEISVEVITRSKRVDDEGQIVEKNQERIAYSTATLHRMLSTNYHHLSKDPKKLAQATEWNRNAIIVPETRQDTNGKQLAPPPVQAARSFETWELCNNKLILTRKGTVKGTLTNFDVLGYIMLSPPGTPEEIEQQNAMLTKNTAAGQVDEDEFIPALLPVSNNELYLYTFSHVNFAGGGYSHKNNISGKASYYECSFEKWMDETTTPNLSLPNQSSSIPSDVKLKKSKMEGRDIYRYQNPQVSGSGLEALMEDPSKPVVLNGTEYTYSKIYDSEKGYTESTTIIKVTLTLQGKTPAVEAIMSYPVAFESWLPEAGANEKAPGNGIPVSVRIEAKDKPDDKAAYTASFKFELIDVSKEKGICTNYPINGTDDFDLKINQELNANLTVPADGQSAESKSGLQQTVVFISAYDWGAYGKLKVTAKLNNGQEVVAYIEGDKEKKSLRIPMDENENRVADAWEKAKGIFEKNLDPLWDEDNQPANQHRNGDGYTLYEEYRGFKTLAKNHVRTSPLKKDLFVYDADGLVKEYYEPHNPAKLELHYVNPTMMQYTGEAKNPSNRWVNFNSGTYRYAKQYALNVRKWTSVKDGVLGSAEGTYAVSEAAGKEGEVAKFIQWSDELSGYDFYHTLEQPLKNIYIVKISPSEIERFVRMIVGNQNQALRQQVFTKMMISTVIHEAGHAIGIRHHANDDPDGLSLGVIDCAMRYTIDDELRNPGQLRANYLYCKKGETWKRSAQRTDKGGKTEYYFEEEKSDNCFGRIDIKSDP